MIGLVLEHWIISGWVVIILGLAISQSKEVIDAAVKSNGRWYDVYPGVLVTGGIGWFFITLISFIKFIWFSV